MVIGASQRLAIGASLKLVIIFRNISNTGTVDIFFKKTQKAMIQDHKQYNNNLFDVYIWKKGILKMVAVK